ncbi:SCO6745 family protein [Rhizohabitans arisaemae]|uniref:SCO6745 family protein n=1 Tax=Rhizohabitans arisaemae TaxID=2720610 RepID=UPI0024B17EEB|nr:hypothetical protein [Rhizohabitans arisaemae]
MTKTQTLAAAVKTPVGALGSGFMMSREAKAACELTGLGSWQMYFRGRFGVLGETDADVVVAVAVFYPADHVRESWDGGRAVPAHQAAERYAQACQAWGRRRFAGFAEAGRLAELLLTVVDNADVTGAPLFAGWRAVPLAEDAPARLAQALYVLRELRGGLHGVAVLASGVSPLDATLIGSEGTDASEGRAMAGFLGWHEPFPDPTAEAVARRAQAELLTDTLIAPAFEVLDDLEQEELARLLHEAHTR